mgnify:CR=1 FL=1
MSEEQWKWVPGYEGRYEVSDLGRVRSYAKGEPRVLRPGCMNRFGHCSVALGRRNSRTVHSLVLETFVGPRPPGCDVRHVNGNGSDNRLVNLAYSSRSENNRDIATHSRRKLTVEQVYELRLLRKNGWTLARLSARFEICLSNAGYVASGRYYGHV